MVGDQAGLEALAQAVLERVEVAREAVGGEDDLAAGVVQRVEGVEELLLGPAPCFLRNWTSSISSTSLRAVGALEPIGVAGVERAEELVREALGRRVADAQPRAVGLEVVARSTAAGGSCRRRAARR